MALTRREVAQKISQVATLQIPQMADASGGFFVYNRLGGLLGHPGVLHC
jgi:hypothetical protein